MKSGISTPAKGNGVDQRTLDLSALNLTEKDERDIAIEDVPKASLAREKLLEEARNLIEAEGKERKKEVSLVVIGHVDAGKSTLMGRMLYEVGKMDEKTRMANERGSNKAGKGSFSWAWSLDGTTEERERGITMDIALQSLSTPHRHITILDAPGHKDFIPNMISGASQADCALLVVDAATGEFEAGFDRGGQTREHILLVRSLGVSQVVVAVNKLDQRSSKVQWSKSRYDEICDFLRPFLVQSGFHMSKTKFAPVAAMQGVNLVTLDGEDSQELRQWYNGPTLADYLGGLPSLLVGVGSALTDPIMSLDQLEPPARDIYAPLRIPISNVFKGSSSGTAISGRLCGGVVQVGERLRVLPGDETAAVKVIEVKEESVLWAVAGMNATLYLTSIDPVHLNIGNVLCPPTNLVPLATTFTARIIVFDIQIPITSGASIELFHHSRDVPATVSNLIATLDRASGSIIKKNPRVLTKGTSAEVQITLRTRSISGPSVARPIPLESFAVNKDMGRILLRRGGETVGAGIVLEIFG
ncbi:EF Tu GTP binding domain-containing protein [Lentinula aciculospora]|uniref:Elongation factor 1 alpha-like protein n=1 Tax=Lentinula aciculospora TaxID=153920 RepID=A0A9W9A2L9_9AGAR|nr:EF Tu GTP binding domain-containing protein [Lentinula aciculospora]